MIVVTGALGFIGSCLISKLNQEGYKEIIAVDDFTQTQKLKNLENKSVKLKIERNTFFQWLDKNQETVDFIFHLGARTDTTEFDYALLEELNTQYSKEVWNRCVSYQIPLVYASSAATYGDGRLGYDDDEGIISKLKPLNPYGESKNKFDLWVITEKDKPFYWIGLKFFNVYGPNEYHKGRMASVILHAYNQIQSTGEMNLFKSHNPNFKDGEQMRDFIYVKDVIDVCFWLMNNRNNSGIYNLGSGKARTFNDLVNTIFKTLGKPPKIDFIDTPEDIRDKYQYYTEANMVKLSGIGYAKDFYTLEAGIADYITKFLLKSSSF